MALAQSGDRKALDRLLRDHQAPLYRHACTITGDGDLALDALQGSLLLIARRLSSLRDPRWFRAWAYRITTREAVRAARRRGRDAEILDPDVEADAAERPESYAPDDREAVFLDRLPDVPPAARIVLQLHYLEDLPLPEIAEALDVPLGTVKSRLAYGLAAMRRLVAVAA